MGKAQLILKFNDKTCWFFHKWKLIKNTGNTKYFECVKCESRKATQLINDGYQPFDLKWLMKK